MATNFLHGVETVELHNGIRPINVVKTAVIGLIGIAPKGEKNKPILVNRYSEAVQFGAQIDGFSIPQSLDAIFKQGGATVIVVNVFDENKHTTTVTDEIKKVSNGKIKLDFAPIGDVTINDNAGSPTPFVKGMDYSIDDFGAFKTIGTAIAEGTTLKFSYDKLDASVISTGDFIGDVNPSTDERTGLKCFDLCFNLFGLNPKILIAPTFSDVPAIATELIATAEKFRAITYLDAPFATTIQGAIEGRGSLGTINFNTSSKRAQLLYPMLKTGSKLFPYSAFLAGVRAFVDNTEGYWVSDSNHEIKGITGAERPISAGISDPYSDANLLNEKGITTVFNSYGTGLRVWGNRSASFPTNTEPDNFICVRRTADIIQESVELACLQFIDQPITQGWIDSVRESVNSFLRTLQGRGAIIDGICKYNPDDNPKTELANGHISFYIDFMPATPAERITFNSFINIDYLEKLK